MTRYDLHWVSTPQERYSSLMNETADRLVAASDVAMIESYGGSGGDVADNGYVVEGTEAQADALAEAITLAIGHDVTVTVTT